MKEKIKKNWKLLLLLSSSSTLLLYFLWDLPNPLRLTTHPAPASTKLLDRNGKLLYEVFVGERRTPIELKSLPKYVWQATLAAEDRDFYSHSGFSIRGIARAFISTFFKQKLQGGSTITQQLVKNALLEPDRTVRRKIREFILSAAVETFYKKDQILEFYLNQVPYGGTAYGIESASRTYFGKPAADLSLAESALLAGLPQAPSFYSPLSRPELAKSRQEYVLKQMLDAKFINQDQWLKAKDQQLNYAPPPSIQAPHFSLWVKDLLIQKYGLEKVEQNGLIVTTTLDLDLQNFTQAAVATEVGRLKSARVGNGAVLVTQPKTGQILAMVGSKDYFDSNSDGNVNVTQSLRQPGSAIKPINYALALEHRLITASSVLADKPTCFLIPDQPPYCPNNYDNQWHGPTQVRFALANSFNIPAVKVLTLNGLENFVASASAFGITTFKDAKNYGPSLTLGGGEVTMQDLATAFGVLANAGQRVNLNPILKVTDRTGQVLEETPKLPSNTRVISTGTAYIISHLLLDNGARSAMFGSSSYLVVRNHPEVSVKTGTTNDRRDNWTIGYNPDVLVAVWVGNNDNSPMSAVASGVTGASPIWNKVISYALKDSSQHWPVQPPDVIGALVCSLSGLKAPDSPPADCGPRYEYFLRGTVPAVQTDSLRRDIPIFRPTGSPASPKQIVENPGDIEYQNHAVIFDTLGGQLCLDCSGGYGEADLVHLDRHGQAIKN
ncbi:MAG: Penicillin-binding protein, 1A family [Candidatus Amesbacteria bacterium GW2011_GWA2_47_11b]|uniref:Penicillin-binding protein, 1A family n=2 Tax=Candidatus Amesiibacteriota TaxID=1752730 RepID=A0A0G1SJS8_9BACT|nr:MAG: Penicillin-binding protein, 1A family [Microgenomates group bacterium GW2011_GWC1_46_20]KKU57605.1 MAG: Penicillin-binding protein, 1A family [Candidatus Amesbacteria bacterium GW2011_GWA2_47_11b]KKU69672.1 MAG: Penicillin-binding protein, 1A family [Candidatus Amesbacteria bacterium GW2011_GWA1_47_20]